MKNIVFLGFVFLICSCSSTLFPDTIDENKPYLTANKSLGSDEENIAYIDDEEITPAAVTPVVKEEKPIIEVKSEEKSDENVKYSQTNYVPNVNYRADTFYFANGSSVLGGEYSANIKKIAKLAKEHNATVTVLGYASSRTRNTDIASHKLANFNVSMARAESVVKALKRAGVKGNNIRIEALSDSNPAYLEVMPEGERLNRRAEVYISY